MSSNHHNAIAGNGAGQVDAEVEAAFLEWLDGFTNSDERGTTRAMLRAAFIAGTQMRRRPRTRKECGEAAMKSRLMKEDWDEMTKQANASPNHVSNMGRWERKAREANPRLDDDQVARLAERMRKAHYKRMGELSGEARRIARQLREES